MRRINHIKRSDILVGALVGTWVLLLVLAWTVS
jgi:hypothetical protein